MTARRHYTAEQRASAVGLALSTGVLAAARQLGIPHRTISHWMRRPDAEAAIVRSLDDVAARLWEAVTVGTDAVLAGLRDPKARLSDKAQALRVVAEQYQLITGQATARTETTVLAEPIDALDDAARRQLLDWIDSVQGAGDAELLALAADMRGAKQIPEVTDVG